MDKIILLIQQFCSTWDAGDLFQLDYDTKKFFLLASHYALDTNQGNQQLAEHIIDLLQELPINTRSLADELQYYIAEVDNPIPFNQITTKSNMLKAVIGKNYRFLPSHITGCIHGKSSNINITIYLKQLIQHHTTTQIKFLSFENCAITSENYYFIIKI